MAGIGVQRFIANDANVIREATVSTADVLPVENAVRSLPVGRTGSARVALTGPYSGTAPATYDVEIVDATLETPRISQPTFTGEGTGVLSNISSTGPAQHFSLELVQSGLEELAAAIDLEGVTIKARVPGADGNAISITIFQGDLVITPQSFSLLDDLPAGSGSQSSPMEGAEFDYGTAIMGADGQIPAGAHRIKFGDDATIYLQYKQYLEGKWQYFLVPPLKRDVPRGAVVQFVTGGRTVTIGSGTPYEVYTNIVTQYDLLVAVQEQSALVMVDGVVANDRSPTGQAAQELQTRTDAYAERTYGEGSEAARGFENIDVADDAGTQLVIATCRAVSPNDHPLAGIGRTRWGLESTTLGPLGTLVEGEAFEGAEFGLRIPRRLPFDFSAPKGRISASLPSYVLRGEGDPDPPPVCVVSLALGSDAVDQSVTFVYTKRPTGDCSCDDLLAPDLNTACLGNVGLVEEGSVTYEVDTNGRLQALRKWYADTVKANSQVLPNGVTGALGEQDKFLSNPTPSTSAKTSLSLKEVVDEFERVIAQIDPLTPSSTPSYRSAGMNEWDDAFNDLKEAVAGYLVTASNNLSGFPCERFTSRLDAVLAYAGISPLGGADASAAESGDGCWRDIGDAYYWLPTGANCVYAPAFNNTNYWSAFRATVKDKYFSTHEFALRINVKEECIADLREGDQFTVYIGVAARPTTYQQGDKLFLPIIAAAPLYLAGGRDESLVQRWLPNGSVSGPLPALDFDPDNPQPYTSGTPAVLAFTLTPGAIPNAKGDRFDFDVEGAHFRWRKDAGAWSVAAPVPAGSAVFDSGLSIEFIPGRAPSFAAGDLYSFQARQPWAASNVRTPTIARWKWPGSSATLDIDCGAVVRIDIITIAMHTLPEGATIQVAGGVAGVTDWTETLTWRRGPIAKPLAEAREARYLRLTLGSATGGSIIWMPIVEGYVTSKSADFTPRPQFQVTRSDAGLYGGGRTLGETVSGDIVYGEGSLSEADVANLLARFQHVKRNNDEPIVFLPQVTRPEEAYLVRYPDELELPDIALGQAKAGVAREHSASFPLLGVYERRAS